MTLTCCADSQITHQEDTCNTMSLVKLASFNNVYKCHWCAHTAHTCCLQLSLQHFPHNLTANGMQLTRTSPCTNFNCFSSSFHHHFIIIFNHHFLIFHFTIKKFICVLDFHFLQVFHVYFIHCYYHLSHAVIFPAKPSVF